jgi:hypothetical protein
MTKQSESTMHTIFKSKLTQDDFVNPVFESTLKELNILISEYQKWKSDKFQSNKIFRKIKDNLPEGFLQRRIICTNYKTIRHIIEQREKHKIKEWRIFCKYLQENCKYKEWLN